MKKLCLFGLLVVMFFVQAVPVLAMGQVTGEGFSVSIESPEEAYVGETITVTVTLSAEKTAKDIYTVLFPRVTVASVLPLTEGLLLVEDADSIEYVLETKLKKNEPTKMIFEVTLSDYAGTMPLLVVSDSEIVLAGEFLYVMSLPELQYSIQAPTEPLVYGGRPFNAIVTVSNPASIDQDFQISVDVYTAGIGRSIYPILNGGDFRLISGNSTSWTYSWQGTVPAGGKYMLVFGMTTGTQVGSLDLILVRDTSTNVTVDSASITLMQGTGDIFGEFGLRGLSGNPVKIGGAMVFDITLYAPVTGQFVLKGIKSPNCTLVGLPAGFMSYPQLSYVHLRYQPTLVSGPVDGSTTCEVSGYFYHTSNTSKLIQLSGRFEVAP